MKNTFFISFFFLTVISYAQDKINRGQSFNLQNTGFKIFVQSGFGNATMDQGNSRNYNIDTRHSTINFGYNFWKGVGMNTGLGIMTLRGNGSRPNQNSSFFHDRSTLKIPILLSLDF